MKLLASLETKKKNNNNNIWKNIWCPLLKAEESDLWFKLKHTILPTKDKLYSFALQIMIFDCFVKNLNKP